MPDPHPLRLEPWFRAVIGHPEGAVVHNGDCRIYALGPVCTCGLLDAARYEGGYWLARFKGDFLKHDAALRALEEDPPEVPEPRSDEEVATIMASLPGLFERPPSPR